MKMLKIMACLFSISMASQAVHANCRVACEDEVLAAPMYQGILELIEKSKNVACERKLTYYGEGSTNILSSPAYDESLALCASNESQNSSFEIRPRIEIYNYHSTPRTSALKIKIRPEGDMTLNENSEDSSTFNRQFFNEVRKMAEEIYEVSCPTLESVTKNGSHSIKLNCPWKKNPELSSSKETGIEVSFEVEKDRKTKKLQYEIAFTPYHVSDSLFGKISPYTILVLKFGEVAK